MASRGAAVIHGNKNAKPRFPSDTDIEKFHK
jgi:hypothetical protein